MIELFLRDGLPRSCFLLVLSWEEQKSNCVEYPENLTNKSVNIIVGGQGIAE